MKSLLSTFLFCAFLTASSLNPSEVPNFEVKKETTEWNYAANFANVKFYWGYGISKSSIKIKAVNGNEEPITIKVKVSGGGEEDEMTFYSIKPGKSETSTFVASMIDNEYAHIKSVSVELLSAD